MGKLTNEVPLSGVPAVDLRLRRPSARSFLFQAVPDGSGLVRRLDAMEQSRLGYNWEDLWQAYLADGYIHRAVVRLRNLVVGSGVSIEGDAEVVRYLNERFLIAQQVCGIGWNELVNQLAFDFVLYGNAFAVKAYTGKLEAVFGRRIRVPRAVAALYPVSPRYLTPMTSNESGEVVAWTLRVSSQFGRTVVKKIAAGDVVHLAYNRTDYLYGVPPLVSVVEDVRALRQVEEDVLRLVHKYAHPLLHIATPDTLGYGEGLRADMQELAYQVNTMVEDGVLITMPGQEVRMIGAESFALRVEPYLDSFKRRVFAGLGMSEVMLGDRPEPLERQVELERQLRDTVEDMQRQLGWELQQRLIRPLLDEAGYRNVRVWLEFPKPDRQAELRVMTVLANLYALNVLSSAEVRQMMGISEPLDKRDTYNWNVNMPRILEPLRLQMSAAGSTSGSVPGVASDDRAPRPRGRRPSALVPPGGGDQE